MDCTPHRLRAGCKKRPGRWVASLCDTPTTAKLVLLDESSRVNNTRKLALDDNRPEELSLKTGTARRNLLLRRTGGATRRGTNSKSEEAEYIKS